MSFKKYIFRKFLLTIGGWYCEWYRLGLALTLEPMLEKDDYVVK